MLVQILLYIFGGDKHHRHKKHKHHVQPLDIEFSLYLINNQIIKGLHMSITILKSQFKTDTDSSLIVTGSIKPTDEAGEGREILADSAEYDTTNDAALTVAKDVADQKLFKLKWVAAGEATIGVSAKSLDGTQLTDTLDIVLVDDTTPPPVSQATKLNMSLDL